MQILEKINMTTKDILQARISSCKMKEFTGKEVSVAGIIIYEDGGKKILAFKTKDGVYIATNSNTFISSFDILLEDNEAKKIVEEGKLVVKICKNKSNSGRDFIYPEFVNF